MIETLKEYLLQIDLKQLSSVIAGLFGLFIAYVKILPLIPRSSTKILSDIELLEKAKSSDIINSDIIKRAIEREVQRKYRKPTRINSYRGFFLALLVLVSVSYFLYGKVIIKQFDDVFFFLSLVAFGALIGLIASFDEPEIDSEEKNIKEIREAVFKFEIFSWGELFGGVITTLIFGFWSFKRFFKNGSIEFDWWGIATLILFFAGLGILTGAFKKEKDTDENDDKKNSTAGNTV